MSVVKENIKMHEDCEDCREQDECCIWSVIYENIGCPFKVKLDDGDE